MSINETIAQVATSILEVSIESVKSGTPWWVVLLAIIGFFSVISSLGQQISKGVLTILYPLAALQLLIMHVKKKMFNKKEMTL